jgi:hypothetical protein
MCSLKVPKDSLGSYPMFSRGVWQELSNYAHCIREIWSSSNHCIHKAPTNSLYGTSIIFWISCEVFGVILLCSLLVAFKGVDIGLQLSMPNHFRILLMYFGWPTLMVIHFQSLTIWIPIKNTRSLSFQTPLTKIFSLFQLPRSPY